MAEKCSECKKLKRTHEAELNDQPDAPDPRTAAPALRCPHRSAVATAYRPAPAAASALHDNDSPYDSCDNNTITLDSTHLTRTQSPTTINMVSIAYAGESKDIPWDDLAFLKFSELQELITQQTNVPVEHQKIFAPKLLKVADPMTLIHELLPQSTRKIMIIGTPRDTLNKLQEQEASHSLMQERRHKRLSHILNKRPLRAVPTAREDADAYKYTFDRIEVLPGLPDQDKAYQVLLRLKNDRGVQAVMRRHKFQVGLLTELDPASNTSHQDMKLGLNVNKGEKICLRIRTDDYKGFCHYKDIRNVLCHELAHNVHGEHDRNFWDLTKLLEKEVVTLDPFGDKGAMIGGDVYTGPMSDELGKKTAEDALIGGSYHLGTASNSPAAAAGGSAPGDEGATAREMLRKAAEERQQRKEHRDAH